MASSGTNHPKRVLHVIHSMRPGGAQTFLLNIFQHIDRSQIQFDFAVRVQNPDFYDEKVKELGGRLFRLPWQAGNPFSLKAYTSALEHVLLNEGPFVALHGHAGLYNGHVLPVGRQAGIPLRITHSHSAGQDKTSVIRAIWAFLMRRRIWENASHLLACSQDAGRWLYGPKWEDDPRSKHIPNGIDLEPYASLHKDRKIYRRQLGLPVVGPLVGHIGRFDAVKNHTFLIDVFAAFLSDHLDANLVLVGEGQLEAKVRGYVAEMGLAESVHFLGVRSDIPELLGALDYFILPSLHEGFGIVLIEAQAAGVPCLVSHTVPQSVDLGLNLVEFVSLDSGADHWAQLLSNMDAHEAPDWNERRFALQSRGYDIQSSAALLQRLYLSEA